MDVCRIGPVKKMSIPNGWKRATYRIAGSGRPELPVVSFRPPGDVAAEIGIFFRGRMESESTGRKFTEYLNSFVGPGKRALIKEEIRELSEILDLAGFNQFSFPPEECGFVPDFRLLTAELEVVNGRVVLVVSGEFLERMDLIDTWYTTVFVDSDGSGRKIYELFYRASEQELYGQHLILFENALQSIEWEPVLAPARQISVNQHGWSS